MRTSKEPNYQENILDMSFLETVGNNNFFNYK
jgi:hypothetical protein